MSSIFKFLENTSKPKPHGCKEPDAALIFGNSIFILEFKSQNQGGSVVEKLQTGKFKQTFYSNRFLNYNVYYIYILSPWFLKNSIVELEFLKEEKIPVFFSNENWIKKLVSFIKKNALY